MLGFYPSCSLVVVGLSGQHNRVHVTFRYDLPDPPDVACAEDIAEHAASVLSRQRLHAAALVGYGPATLVTPVMAAVADRLLDDEVELVEMLRAESGRYWSVLCEDPTCCPAEGRPFDPGSHPVAAAMTEAGMPALADREALARTLLPPAGGGESIRGSTRLAEQRLCDLGTQYWANGGKDPQECTARTGRAAVGQAIRRYRAGESITSGDELAWLAVLLADLRVRDDAWARMDPRHCEAHSRLWTDVVRSATSEYVPAPAALLAFVAWQAGNGALGSVAVQRALAARPGYSMALLIGRALEGGLPPSAARLPMTPAQVAASYAAQQASTRRTRQTGTGESPPARRSSQGGKKKRAASRQSARARSRAAADAADTGSGTTRSGGRTSGASSRPSG
jgi:Domain of unknown function (DUF4192)